MFEGMFKRGKKEGFGKLYWHDENPDPLYFGDYEADQKSGFGVSFFENGKMEAVGRFKSDRLDETKFFRRY